MWLGAHNRSISLNQPSLGVYGSNWDQQGLGASPLVATLGNTQASGSSLLIFSAAKLTSVAGVSHNQGGAVSNVSSLVYTVWNPYGARFDWVQNLSGGAGQTVSISMNSPDQADEKTIFGMEVKNGRTLSAIAPVELASAATPTCSDITTTGPAVLFCGVWGDANVATPMNLLVHADSLAAGWVQIGDVSIDGIAHIQGALAARVVTSAATWPGCKWDLTPAQRLLVFTGSVQT